MPAGWSPANATANEWAWNPADATYFTVSTFLGSGFGDVVPSSTAGRTYAIVVHVASIVAAGAVVGASLSDMVKTQVRSGGDRRRRAGEREGRRPRDEEPLPRRASSNRAATPTSPGLRRGEKGARHVTTCSRDISDLQHQGRYGGEPHLPARRAPSEKPRRNGD